MRPTIEGRPVLQSLYGGALRTCSTPTSLRTDSSRPGPPLLKVCDTSPDGSQVIAQDNQWWDQISWVIGAWQHYLVTGDTVFAASAYRIGSESVEILDRPALCRHPRQLVRSTEDLVCCWIAAWM